MNSAPFVKMLLHAAKYPHCSVNGIFVRKKTKDQNSSMSIIDCIPLFHINMTLLPMLELALCQIEAYCTEQNLAICGYYHMHSNINDERPDPFIQRLMERFAENCGGKVLLYMIDNRKLNSEGSQLPYTNFECKDGKMVSCSSVKLEDGAIEDAISAIEDEQYQQLVDFDNHLDDISLDWRNIHIPS